MEFQAVIFDLDGTLLNTIADLTCAGNKALVGCGFCERTEEDFKYFVGSGRHNMVLRMLPPEACANSETVEKAERIFDEYYSAHMFDKTVPYPGIAELLHALKKEGVKLAVVSNKPDEFVQPLIEREFPGVFDAVCGQQGGIIKPDPAGVNRALTLMGISASQALYVGDSGVDMQTAQNAHCRSCGVTWGFRTKKELVQNGADHTVDTPLELFGLIQGKQPAGKAKRLFSLAVAAIMILCLVGVVVSLARGDVTGVTAGIIFPVVLGFASVRLLRR